MSGSQSQRLTSRRSAASSGARESPPTRMHTPDRELTPGPGAQLCDPFGAHTLQPSPFHAPTVAAAAAFGGLQAKPPRSGAGILTRSAEARSTGAEVFVRVWCIAARHALTHMDTISGEMISSNSNSVLMTCPAGICRHSGPHASFITFGAVGSALVLIVA